MVANLTTDQAVEIELRSLQLMLGDLDEVAAEWEQLGDGERVGWALDWGQVMGALEVVLDPRYRSGAMTREQQAAYVCILDTLKRAVPTLRELGLGTPDSALGA